MPGIQIPNQRQTDSGAGVDTILKTINTVQGFRESQSKIEKEKQEALDNSNNALSPEKKATFLVGGGIIEPIVDGVAAPPGAVAINDRQPDGSYVPSWMHKPKETKDKKELTKLDLMDAQGNAYVGNYNGVTGVVTDTAGNVIKNPVPFRVDRPDKALTQDQTNAGLFGKRALEADSIMNNLVAKGYDRTDTSQGVLSSRFVPNILRPTELQQQDQAERNFVNAVLRKESGANINAEEFANAEKQYFPRAGDAPEVLAQKSQNREQAIEGLKGAAGPAWEKIVDVPLKAPKQKSNSSGTASAAPANKPPVTQGGHTYIWNDKIGKYE